MIRDIMIPVLDVVLAASFLGILVLVILVVGLVLGGHKTPSSVITPSGPRRIAKTINAAVDKIRGAPGAPLVACLALAVFVAWAAIDSIPKIARISTAHEHCGTWSGSCPKEKDNAPPGAYYDPGPAFPHGFAPAGYKGHYYDAHP